MQGVRNRALHIISSILLVSGSPGKPNEICDNVLKYALNDLERLWELATIFAEKVKEQVSSTDYQLFYIDPSVEYDVRFMRNQGSVQAAKQQKISHSKPPKVLCTVELGVKRVENPAKPGERNDGRLEEVIMVKAVVIFESEADALCH